MAWQDRIAIDPKVLVGKPVIRGTRVAVEFLVELLAEGWTHEQISKNYPQLTADDIQATLHDAAEALRGEKVHALRGTPLATSLEARESDARRRLVNSSPPF